MEIINFNYLNELKRIVSERARYQKVMLLFDNSIANSELLDIYNSIKEECIFNKLNIENDSMDEVNDGYKLIIYKCQIDSFLKLEFDRRDYVNVYMPSDNYFLPYFLDIDSILNESNDYLFIPNGIIDTLILPSVYFNRFQKNIEELSCDRIDKESFSFALSEVNQQTLLKVLSHERELMFLDIDIIKKCDLPYRYLSLVDYVLISAYLVMLRAIKTHNISMVDTYKVAKENMSLIDKFYAMSENDILSRIIRLNINKLDILLFRTKSEILEYIDTDFALAHLDEVIMKVKEYIKRNDGLISYLYLYNIFGI